MATIKSSGPLPSTDVSPVDPYIQITPGGPVIIVVPAAAFRASAIPVQFVWYIIAFFIHTILTIMPACIAGPGPGALSGVPMSACRSSKGSVRLIVQLQLVPRSFLDPGFQNGPTMNSMAPVSSPGQTTIINPTG